MTQSECDDYLADREANPTHVESCDACQEAVRKLEALERGIAKARLEGDGAAVDPEALPVAAWEGASTRSWLAVMAVALVVAGLGLGGFVLLGINPIEGFVGALSGAMSAGHLLAVAKSAPNFLASAPMHVHAMIFAAFVLVNVIFVILLRKRLRGYDA